ncbi:MAG: hypothetical protein AVDCRST_MAG54-93, partial [uncultured Actinomycetospora sp.]
CWSCWSRTARPSATRWAPPCARPATASGPSAPAPPRSRRSPGP